MHSEMLQNSFFKKKFKIHEKKTLYFYDFNSTIKNLYYQSPKQSFKWFSNSCFEKMLLQTGHVWFS